MWTCTRSPYPFVSSREPEAEVVFCPDGSLLVFVPDDTAGGVFRFRDGASELLLRRAELSIEAAYFDARTGAPAIVFTREGSICVADFIDGDFRERTLDNAGELEYGDTLYTARGELYHTYRPTQQTALFRVLREGGFEVVGEMPEALAEPGTMGSCAAAFDEVLGVHVFVCNDAARTFDGKTWQEIAVPPGASHISDRDLAVTDPRTGHALFIEGPDGDPAVFHRFDGKEWSEVGRGPMTTWQGVGVDRSRKTLVFFQAQRDAKSETATFVVWDGEQLREEGSAISEGEVRCGELGRIESTRRKLVWRPRSGAAVSCAKNLWAPIVTPGGPLAFENSGAVWGLVDGALAKIADGPAGYTARARMTSVWDPQRKVTLLFGGTPLEGNAMLKDVWAFDGTQFEPVKWKPPISAIDAGAAYSPKLDRIVVAGGVSKWKGPPAATFEVAGDRTIACEPAKIVDPGDSAKLVTDTKSGLVVGTSYGAAAVYLGNGRWEPAPAAPEHAHSMSFDPATRTLHVKATEGRIRAEYACEIGAWLDGLPAPTAARADDKPLEPQQSLVLFGDKAHQFWTARLDGNAYTAEWGVRGATTTTKKTYEHRSAAEARTEFERDARERLDDGYVAFAGDPRVLAGKNAFPLTLADGGADAWGGVPPYFDDKTWPRCTQCKKPLAFVMLLHKHPERLPLAKHDAVAVFVCNGPSCETYDARDGNHVALVAEAQLRATGKAPEGARTIERKQIAYTSRFEAAPEEDIAREPAWNKAGGYPDFIQGAQTVACAECDKPMMPVAQFTDDLDETAKLNFGDRGCGYVVVCPDEHDAAFFWQCY
jgi:predicted DNA-binding WGR domain protein